MNKGIGRNDKNLTVTECTRDITEIAIVKKLRVCSS